MYQSLYKHTHAYQLNIVSGHMNQDMSESLKQTKTDANET